MTKVLGRQGGFNSNPHTELPEPYLAGLEQDVKKKRLMAATGLELSWSLSGIQQLEPV